MSRLIIGLCWLGAMMASHAFAQTKDRKGAVTIIKSIMSAQEEAWNRGDLETFMEGYWRSDSLQFIGSRGINRGWQNTLDGYKKGYPTREAMGTLRFEILQYKPIGNKAVLVTGKFFLSRSIGDLSGIFTLLFQRKKGKWVIVYDHTS
ncbi:MAG: DUF4440 domain-containing protein [Cyclobacteriaceae bacterium]